MLPVYNSVDVNWESDNLETILVGPIKENNAMN